MTRGRHRKTRVDTISDLSDAEETPPGQVDTSPAGPHAHQPEPDAADPAAALDGESDDRLTVHVVPAQADEFTCGRCQLVHHHSQLAEAHGGRAVCRDCT
ncbi:MAG: DUF4193 family protein [Nocardioidaceae bacterium]